MAEAQTGIPTEIVPPILRDKVGPEAPKRLRQAIARAQVPMPPAQLGVALGVLAHDADREISTTAVSSLRDLPRSVMQALAGGQLHARILDVYARVLSNDLDVMRALLRNEACHDSTIEWMARSLRGPILPNIGTNQRRLLRSPKIIEGLINNPATPTPTVAAVLETAIRNRLDLGMIQNAKVLAEGFFGKIDDMLIAQAGEELVLKKEEGLEAEVMEALLREGVRGAEEEKAEEEKAEEEAKEVPEERKPEKKAEPEEEETKVLWRLVAKMNMAQKVRLAMVGDINARKILIRDVKRSVFMTVLRSPRLTKREISSFAMNKALNEDIIRFIAKQREWTKNYRTRMGLIRNPKCPPSQALTFLRSLSQKDLAKIARAKDVPTYVARAAKVAVEKKMK